MPIIAPLKPYKKVNTTFVTARRVLVATPISVFSLNASNPAIIPFCARLTAPNNNPMAINLKLLAKCGAFSDLMARVFGNWTEAINRY